MNALIFAGGIVLGALVTFVFVFIMIAIGNRDKGNSPKMDSDLIKELWHEYIKEMKDDGK